MDFSDLSKFSDYVRDEDLEIELERMDFLVKESNTLLEDENLNIILNKDEFGIYYLILCLISSLEMFLRWCRCPLSLPH